MARFAYRCNVCRTRNMFRKKVEDYVRPRKCKSCGHTTFYWDKARNLRTFSRRDDVCYCSTPYGHPHRRGSKWCEHHRDAMKLCGGEFQEDGTIHAAPPF